MHARLLIGLPMAPPALNLILFQEAVNPRKQLHLEWEIFLVMSSHDDDI